MYADPCEVRAEPSDLVPLYRILDGLSVLQLELCPWRKLDSSCDGHATCLWRADGACSPQAHGAAWPPGSHDDRIPSGWLLTAYQSTHMDCSVRAIVLPARGLAILAASTGHGVVL